MDLRLSGSKNIFTAGFAQSVITPEPAAVFLDGFGLKERMRPAEGVRDDIYVKAAAFKSGESAFVILAFDVCGLNAELYELAVERVCGKTGLKKENLAVCSTHTHSGPGCGVLSDVPVNPFVWIKTVETAAETAAAALENMEACTLRSGCAGRLDSVYNRRDANKSADTDVYACAFYTKKGSTLKGAIFSAGCHPVVYRGNKISADFPGVLYADAEKSFPDVPFLFLQGGGAEIDPVRTADKEMLLKTLGGELSAAALGFVKAGKEGAVPECLKAESVAARIKMSAYPPGDESEAQMRKAAERMFLSDPELRRWGYAEWKWYLGAKGHAGQEGVLNLPLQLLALGTDALMVFCGCEVFAATERKLRRILAAAGFLGTVFIVSHANGSFGYLPAEEEVPLGGYEVCDANKWYGLPLPGPESEKELLNAVEKLTAGLRLG